MLLLHPDHIILTIQSSSQSAFSIRRLCYRNIRFATYPSPSLTFSRTIIIVIICHMDLSICEGLFEVRFKTTAHYTKGQVIITIDSFQSKPSIIERSYCTGTKWLPDHMHVSNLLACSHVYNNKFLLATNRSPVLSSVANLHFTRVVARGLL